MAESDRATEQDTKRYDQERWLQAALDILAQKGGAKLRIESITSSLNVTKGSFYHHFRDRQDFVARLSAYWSAKYTDVVIQEAGAFSGSGYQKLAEVMRLVTQFELDKYDSAFRSWAAQDPLVAKVVHDVDLARYRFIHGLFEEMGFSGNDLEMRVRVWLVYASAGGSVNFPALPQSDQPDENAVLNFFTGKQS